MTRERELDALLQELGRLAAEQAGQAEPATPSMDLLQPLSEQRLERIVDAALASAKPPVLKPLRPSGVVASHPVPTNVPNQLGSGAAQMRGRLSSYWPLASAAAIAVVVATTFWAEAEKASRERASEQLPLTELSAVQPHEERSKQGEVEAARSALPHADTAPPANLPPSAVQPSARDLSVGVGLSRPARADEATPYEKGKEIPSLARPIGVSRRERAYVHSRFSVEQATAGLGEGTALLARLHTDLGTVECELWPDRAPTTVANFVSLARGLRPFLDTRAGQWVQRPFYDGTVFHRVEPGYFIQGGDPSGAGTDGAGYNIPDEVWPGARHDQPGLLCMANDGRDTGSSQFFILDRELSGDLSSLDGSYTIFGRCSSLDVIGKLARVPAVGGRPVTPPRVQRVEVLRSQTAADDRPASAGKQGTTGVPEVPDFGGKE